MTGPGVSSRRACLKAALAAGFLWALAPACRAVGADAYVFNGQRVPHASRRDFVLTDHTGARRGPDDFRGRVVLMFFGFTSCPDVCPTELARLAEAMRLLGPAAQQVQVLFVTLDPERDSAALLGEYLAAFSPEFIGLRGSVAETARTAETFQVFYRRLEGSAPDRYTLEHSAYIHAIDPQGRLRLRFTGRMSPADIAADVRALLEED